MEPGSSPLLTDLYQLNMIEAYLSRGETKMAVFELFVRKLLRRRGFLIAAGLEQALEFLETVRFSSDEIGWLKSTERFSARTLAYLADFSLHWRCPCHA
jgi:nicotinate phosphoribosyltransferase